MNKINLYIIFFLLCQVSLASDLEVNDFYAFRNIDSNIQYDKVKLNNLCLDISNIKVQINSKYVEIESCFIKENVLNELFKWNSLEEIVITNSIILDSIIDLNASKYNFKFTLSNVQSDIKVIGLDKLSIFKLIDCYNVSFDITELTEKLVILHLESISFPNFQSIKDLSGLEELAIIGYDEKFKISNLDNLTLLLLRNLQYLPEINNITTLEYLWLTEISVVDTSSVQNLIKLNKSTLESIWLTNLELENIPTEVFNCNHLNNLVLNNNSITNIGLELLKLNNLVNLSLSNNNLEYIDKSIFSLNKLSDLNIKGNNIKNLGEVKYLNKSIYIHWD